MRVAPPSRYDLCISGDLSRDAMRACLQDARRLGYTVVALNRSVQRVTPTTKVRARRGAHTRSTFAVTAAADLDHSRPCAPM